MRQEISHNIFIMFKYTYYSQNNDCIATAYRTYYVHNLPLLLKRDTGSCDYKVIHSLFAIHVCGIVKSSLIVNFSDLKDGHIDSFATKVKACIYSGLNALYNNNYRVSLCNFNCGFRCVTCPKLGLSGYVKVYICMYSSIASYHIGNCFSLNRPLYKIQLQQL